MTVYCATTNAGKLREFRQSAPPAIKVEVLPALHEIEPPDETGATFEENAILKALHYGAHHPGYVFVDDSGLEVDALNGAPGVWSARFAGAAATDATNNALLLEKLSAAPDRTARFVCVVALAHNGKLVGTFRGAVEGQIALTPTGPNGFGYDPLFYYPPFGCTFGEAPLDQKMTVSHRSQALHAMFQSLLVS
ncbi:MAG: RdgB/HAM1 family non-canonical purine NTP pyrophosphatase [Bryobacteraceae bacterium]